MKGVLIAMLVTLVAGVTDARAADKGDLATVVVGTVTREFADDARRSWDGDGPRPLKTVVWFPADVRNLDEPSRKTKKYPLVLLSHGASGRASDMVWLGWVLAEHGYIAASVGHTEEERRMPGDWPPTEFQVWERPRDLTVVLDKLLADPVLGKRIDRKRIGAAGFSLGGYTVIATAGAVLNMEALKASSPPPPVPEIQKAVTEYTASMETNPRLKERLTHAEESYRDKRIKGVFALAPAIGGGFTKPGLAGVDVPVEIVVGDADVVTRSEENARRYADGIKGAKLTILDGEAGHFIASTDPAAQAAIMAKVASMAVAFFDELFGRR